MISSWLTCGHKRHQRDVQPSPLCQQAISLVALVDLVAEADQLEDERVVAPLCHAHRLVLRAARNATAPLRAQPQQRVPQVGASERVARRAAIGMAARQAAPPGSKEGCREARTCVSMSSSRAILFRQASFMSSVNLSVVRIACSI